MTSQDCVMFQNKNGPPFSQTTIFYNEVNFLEVKPQSSLIIGNHWLCLPVCSTFLFQFSLIFIIYSIIILSFKCFSINIFVLGLFLSRCQISKGFLATSFSTIFLFNVLAHRYQIHRKNDLIEARQIFQSGKTNHFESRYLSHLDYDKLVN